MNTRSSQGVLVGLSRTSRKFADLADDLSYIATKLNDLLPATLAPSVSQSEPSPAQEFVGRFGTENRAIPNTVQGVVDQKYQDKDIGNVVVPNHGSERERNQAGPC